jgi:hypothetical protein
MASSIPSARTLLQEALEHNPNLDINSLHAEVFNLMVYYRLRYYEVGVDSFLSKLDLPDKLRRQIKQKMLEPVQVADKEYSNFMEKISRRVSQAFQPISGNVAELCVERELTRIGLVKDVNFTRRRERTDIIVYYPDTHRAKSRHRIEVKNVKLRERATRGLLFDGDSLFGFFNDEREFTESNVKVIDSLCAKTKGYCYIPPATLSKMAFKGSHFRSNTMFAYDMLNFAKTGKIA